MRNNWFFAAFYWQAYYFEGGLFSGDTGVIPPTGDLLHALPFICTPGKLSAR